MEDIEVIVGTYEEFLLGYKIKNKDGQYIMVPTFTTKSHTASVRCVAASGKYLASGGADDKIFVFDMNERREIQILMNHEGTVNTMTFTPDSKHLLSGSDDGRMFATRVGSWNVNGYWSKAHDGSPVKYIACHPSGKIVLTLGQDLTVRTWNIITGRCLFKTNLKTKPHLGKSPECIEWSPNGNYFLLSGSKIVEVISIEDKKTIKEVLLESKPVCVCWLSDEVFAVGLEDGKIIVTTINDKTKMKIFEASQKRIKSMVYKNNILAMASSSGEVILWNVNLEDCNLKKIVSTNIGCRPTCIAILNSAQFTNDEESNDEELVEEKMEHEKHDVSKVDFDNLQHVTIEYEDDDLNGGGNNSDESDDKSNNVGAYVLLKKKRKIEHTSDQNIKRKIKNKKKHSSNSKTENIKQINKKNTVTKNVRKKQNQKIK